MRSQRWVFLGILVFAIALPGCPAQQPAPDTGPAPNQQIRKDNAPEEKGAEKGDSVHCSLRLILPEKASKKDRSVATVEIANDGDGPVTLVLPGDGSTWGWRTPKIGWSILSADSEDPHPDWPSKPDGLRCGNINALDADEVFTLDPGAFMPLGEWLGFPNHALAPGRYRVVFYYANVPDLEWQGLPLGKHDAKAMETISGSTPLTLRSNEAVIEITP